MTNQLGVVHMWAEGGFVIQLTAIALLVMSIISWTVIVVKGLMIHRSKKQAKALHHFWHSADLNEGLKSLSSSDDKGINTFKLLALEGQHAMAHHRHTERLHPDRMRSPTLCRPACRRRSQRIWDPHDGDCAKLSMRRRA